MGESALQNASALENGARRTVHRIARYTKHLMKTQGLSKDEASQLAVAAWMVNKGKPRAQRDEWFQRSAVRLGVAQGGTKGVQRKGSGSKGKPGAVLQSMLDHIAGNKGGGGGATKKTRSRKAKNNPGSALVNVSALLNGFGGVKPGDGKSMNALRRAVIRQLRAQGGEKYTRGFAKRVLGASGAYILHGKKKKMISRKVAGRELTFPVRDYAFVKGVNESREARRAKDLPGHAWAYYENVKGIKRGQKGTVKGKWQQKINLVTGEVWPDQAPGGIPGKSKAASSSKSKGASKNLSALRKQAVSMGLASRVAKTMDGEALDEWISDRLVGIHAHDNGLAFSSANANPAMGAMSYITGYALPVTVAGGVAGAVHGFASTFGVTSKITDVVAKVPVVGEKVAEYAPFTLQGLIVGSGLALAAGFVGGQAGKYLALTGGAALVLGGGIDAFNFALSRGEGAAEDEDEESDADLASELSAADEGENLADLGFQLGDLGFERGLGDLGFAPRSNPLPFADAVSGGLGDGFAFETVPLTMASDNGTHDYGQATLADAQYSGADFSGPEGEALLNGRDQYFRAFGRPPVRISRFQHQASHLAGRPGHRWGWLIKTVGWERARHIAGMAPANRVAIIHRIRKGAVDAYSAAIAQYQQEQQASVATESSVTSAPSTLAPVVVPPSAGTVATAPSGAQGVTSANTSYLAGVSSDYLGDFLGDPQMFTS